MKDTTMEDLCAKVHKNAIETVADTTAGTTIDILNELLQNARMAEATRIDIEIKDHRITVTDNGHGILNPEAILTYGQIAWKDKRLSQEAAGIGLFALSNRSVEIASRQEADDTGNQPKGWIVYLTPEAFRGWTPAFPEYSDLVAVGNRVTPVPPLRSVRAR